MDLRFELDNDLDEFDTTNELGFNDNYVSAGARYVEYLAIQDREDEYSQEEWV